MTLNPFKWLVKRKQRRDFYILREGLREKSLNHHTVRMQKAMAEAQGLTVKYYLVTVRYQNDGFVTEAWSIMSDKTVQDAFQDLHSHLDGKVALIGFWEASQEIFNEIKLTDDTVVTYDL